MIEFAGKPMVQYFKRRSRDVHREVPNGQFETSFSSGALRSKKAHESYLDHIKKQYINIFITQTRPRATTYHQVHPNSTPDAPAETASKPNKNRNPSHTLIFALAVARSVCSPPRKHKP